MWVAERSCWCCFVAALFSAAVNLVLFSSESIALRLMSAMSTSSLYYLLSIQRSKWRHRLSFTISLSKLCNQLLERPTTWFQTYHNVCMYVCTYVCIYVYVLILIKSNYRSWSNQVYDHGFDYWDCRIDTTKLQWSELGYIAMADVVILYFSQIIHFRNKLLLL